MYPQLQALGYKFCLGIAAHLIIFSSLSQGQCLTNGMVLELSKLKESLSVTNKFVYVWCCQLLGRDLDMSKNSITKMNKSIKYIRNKEKKLQKSASSLGKDKLGKFLHGKFLQYPNEQHHKVSATKPLKSELTKQVNRCNSLMKQNTLLQKSYRNSIQNIFRMKRTLVDLKYSLANRSKAEVKLLKSNKILKNSAKNAETGMKAMQKCLQNEKIRIRYINNITRMEKKRTIEKCKYWENIAQKTRYLKDHLQAKHETEVKLLQEQILNMRQEQKANKHEINKTKDELHFLLDNLNEQKQVDLTVPAPNGKYTFSTDTNLCIMELLNANVAFEKVSCVMSSVMKLCNVDSRNNIFPKKDYVSTISATRLFVSQAHAAIVCSEQVNQTLYTDETKKNGQPYGVFVTTNEDKKPFLLGLRQMSNKAAQTQLDVFKQILGDIELRYNQVTTNDVNNKLSIKILQNIKCTMSDRAATQVSFNQLLESYRSSMLQEHLENYHLLQEPDQMLLSKMYNFFCGLHLLVNIAELMNSVFNNFHKDPPEGTEHPEISLKGESSVLNAVRIASKALASGADEKNGVYLEFKTYLQRQQINRYEIKPFLGNRFNVVFHNAGAIYHLRSHIMNFLKNVKGEGTPGKLNQLLKAVLSCLQNDTIMVGCRALGLFNKFITSPLWKILEGDIHILHMNQKYQQLVQFLEDISTDVEKIKLFMTGELVPFPSVDVKKDEIWASLVSNHNDEQCAAFLIQMCSATSKALSQKVKDHLGDGQHTQYGIDRSKTFNSVLPHNKLPEFIFGHLDWLIKHRPNASRLANEAHIVYNVNKTGAWLNQQTEQNVQELINRSKLKIKDIKITEKQRLLDLKNELERISREKEEKAKRILIKKCNEKKKLVEHILKLGLWDNARKVDQELTKIKFIKNKREILKTQIKFRQLVLEQPGEKTLFQVSQVNKKPVTISQLTKNLKTLIKKLGNAAVPTQILEHTIAEDLHDFGGAAEQ